MSLLESSISGQYYFGDLPGTLQYKLDQSKLKLLTVPSNSDTFGYVLAEHSLENKLRVTPDTHTAKQYDWKLMLVMKKEADGEVWLKAALIDNSKNLIAVITSTNSLHNIVKNGNRGIKSKYPGWFVGHYRMCAPAIFWTELVNRINY